MSDYDRRTREGEGGEGGGGERESDLNNAGKVHRFIFSSPARM